MCSLLFFFLLPPLMLPAAERNSIPLNATETVPGGNFEDPVLPASPGWVRNPTGGTWTYGNGGLSRNGTGFTAGNPPAPEGNQVLFIQSFGSAQVSNVTFAEGYYQFDLMAAQRGNFQATFQRVDLRIDGQTVWSITPSGTTYEAMSSDPIYVTSGSHTLQFRGVNPNGGDNTVFIDQFTSTRIPQPVDGFESPVIATLSGFEYAPSGGPWTFVSPSGITRNATGFTNGNPNAPEGDQVGFFKSSGRASRDLVVNQAGFYRIRYRAALRGNNGPATEKISIRVSVNGIPLGESPLSDFNYVEFTTLTTHLSAGTHTLQIEGVNPEPGDNTGFVDDVRLEMVPGWQDPYTWNGQIPNANDIATIPAGSAVALHDTMVVDRLIINGELLGVQSHDLDLSANNIMVMGSGAQFAIGQPAVPYPADALITLTAAETDPPVSGAPGNNFLMAMNGGTLHLHGTETLSWTQLQANASNGTELITLKEAVDWVAGDKIVIVSSRKDWNEAEERTIAEVQSGGTVLELDAALSYPHTGVTKSYSNANQTWTVDLRAEVGRLSRNLTVQGNSAAAATGFGGHIMIHSNGQGYASGVELYHMGQKAELGRYPWHWHLLDDAGTGQFLKNSSVHHSFNRGVTIHGTDGTIVENNFFYDQIGHCVFLEDGVEQFNQIRNNVVALTRRPAQNEELTPSDNQFDEVQNRTPSSFWITNPLNVFEGNVAAGTEGTGFWFAFPQSPLGLSATDPRFAGMEPYKTDLLSFKGNRAHSCMSGFDVFDQLDANHAIVRNGAWLNENEHLIEDCQWYANDLAIYTGSGGDGPTENLIFRNNALVENTTGTMFANESVVDSSVFVANSGESLIAGTRAAYRTYDGPGQVYDSHFADWNSSNANLLNNFGAAFKHPNHLFDRNSLGHSGTVRQTYPDYYPSPSTPPIGQQLPLFWSVVVRDLDGTFTGQPNTNIVSNHPFMLAGDETMPSNWSRAYVSTHEFALTLLRHEITVPPEDNPVFIVTREKAGTPTPHVYHFPNNKQQFPVMVNEDFVYEVEYTELPATQLVKVYFLNANPGDECLHKFKDFGKLGGRTISSTGTLTGYFSLASLEAASGSGYYVEPNGDLYLKPVATAINDTITIAWTTDFAVAEVDTDGDQMPDTAEIAANRHPFTASDLAAEFDVAGNYEGWDDVYQVTGLTLGDSKLQGTSGSDAQLKNDEFNFLASEVPYLRVGIEAQSNTTVMVFFSTNTAPGYSGTRRVDAYYSGTPGQQTLTFDMAAHPDWNGTITNLRLDPVFPVGVDFKVDWIRAAASAKSGAAVEPIAPGEAAAVQLYPNPFSERLVLDLGESGTFHTVRVTDIMGRRLRTVAIPAGAGKLDLRREVSLLSPGVYLLSVLGDAHQAQFRLVKE
ncbi:MAG: G8 domain-containing protein [Bacteroidota bacterium]